MPYTNHELHEFAKLLLTMPDETVRLRTLRFQLLQSMGHIRGYAHLLQRAIDTGDDPALINEYAQHIRQQSDTLEAVLTVYLKLPSADPHVGDEHE